jgi:hypothetical protein
MGQVGSNNAADAEDIKAVVDNLKVINEETKEELLRLISLLFLSLSLLMISYFHYS